MSSLVESNILTGKESFPIPAVFKCAFVCSFFVKSSGKLLTYLKFGQTLIEVKMEMLKTNRICYRLNQLRMEFLVNQPFDTECTYECMYVRTYVCTYVRMYVCTYVRMYACMLACM